MAKTFSKGLIDTNGQQVEKCSLGSQARVRVDVMAETVECFTTGTAK
jgi:hypothetical protein